MKKTEKTTVLKKTVLKKTMVPKSESTKTKTSSKTTVLKTKKISKPKTLKTTPKITKKITSTSEKKTKQLKIFQGVVVSNKSKKTIVVKVERKGVHNFYKKIIVKHKKFHVHDENEESKIGDVVKFISCRPISLLKKWRLLTIIKK